MKIKNAFMNDTLVMKLRMTIYILFFITLTYLCITKLCADPSSYHLEAADPEPESSEFWPPDMVPHPTLPEPRKESDLA